MCICHFLKPIRKLDAKDICLRANQIYYWWVYKGRIPLKNLDLYKTLKYEIG